MTSCDFAKSILLLILPRVFTKYRAIFLLSFRERLKNVKVWAGLSIFLITCLVIFAHLWKFAAAKLGGPSFDPASLLWYIALNDWVIISVPDLQDEMEHDLRSGRLAYLLPRPVSYLGAIFAEALGTLVANLLILGVVAFVFTFWQTGTLPFPLLGLGPALLLGLFAGILAIICRMLIGLSAFWLREVDPFFWIWEKMLFMLGGLMLPLAVYPPWLQSIAFLTPFPAILGERSALALHFEMGQAAAVAGSLLGWGIFGVLALLLLYQKGLKILNVEGG